MRRPRHGWAIAYGKLIFNDGGECGLVRFLGTLGSFPIPPSLCTPLQRITPLKDWVMRGENVLTDKLSKLLIPGD